MQHYTGQCQYFKHPLEMKIYFNFIKGNMSVSQVGGKLQIVQVGEGFELKLYSLCDGEW